MRALRIQVRRLAFAAFAALFCLVPTTGAALAAPVAASSDAGARSSDATPEEIELGRKGTEAIEKRWAVLRNPALQARAEMIVRRLEPFMSRRLRYDVRIVDQEMANAFSLADGTIYVCTGMLDFVRTDLELGGVLAHEMAHADRGHVVTQLARNNRMTLLGLAALIASRGRAPVMIMTEALQLAVMGAYSIDMEEEADALGIDALVKAGYNPVGVLTLQERMEEESLKRAPFDPGVARTHPEARARIAAAAKYMEDRGIEINRKYALGALRPAVEAVSGDLVLTLDGAPVWRGRDDEPTRALFARVGDALWRELRLETAPYDIRAEGEALQIEGREIARADELPDGAEPLPTLREGIQNALNAARRGHPMADYY